MQRPYTFAEVHCAARRAKTQARSNRELPGPFIRDVFVVLETAKFERDTVIRRELLLLLVSMPLPSGP